MQPDIAVSPDQALTAAHVAALKAIALGGTDANRTEVLRRLIEALEALPEIGLPAIIRPSFTLGGTGGGVAYNKSEFEQIVRSGLDASPTTEVLIEESLLGWKEYEMEVVRDRNDNAIIICSIENVDPMGVHTGDSITVAPAQTLTDKEYQRMRDLGRRIIRRVVPRATSKLHYALGHAIGNDDPREASAALVVGSELRR